MFSNHKHSKQNSDESFHLQSNQSDSLQQKQVYKPRNQRSDFQKVVEGSWTQTQKGLFLAFMHYHQNIFISKRKRTVEKIFRFMADFLGNRNPAQCRSHFQKLIKKYRRVRYILNQAHKQIEEGQYKMYCHQVEQKLSHLKSKQKNNVLQAEKAEVKDEEVEEQNKMNSLFQSYHSNLSLSYLILSQNNINHKNMIQNEIIKQQDEAKYEIESNNNVKEQQ